MNLADYLHEADRMAEWLSDNDLNDTEPIKFDLNFKNSFPNNHSVKLKGLVLDALRERNDLFERAGGKTLKFDKQKKARNIVFTEQEYIKKGAQKVDLYNFDTPNKKAIYGYIKNQIVKVKKTQVTIYGHKISKYRDKKGRFAKLII